MTAFHFGVFPGKTNYKISLKMQKGTFLVHFARSGGKLEFSSKIGLSHFLDYFDPNVIQKNRKKLMGQF